MYQNTPSRPRAFTLIEVLIALVIVAIVTTVTVMSFGDFGRKRRERVNIISLRNHLEAARQEAILSTGTIGLHVNRNGYTFYRYWVDPQSGQAQWRPMTSELSQPMAFKGSKLTLTPTINSKKTNQPQFFFYPNGTLTPFRLSLTYPSSNRFDLTISNSGNIAIESR